MDNTATIKTIYDPSVSGFALPRTAAFTRFTSTGDYATTGEQFNVSGSFTKGWNLYTNDWRTGSTIFFNALGSRDTYSGRSTGTGFITFVFVRGGYWASGAYSASGGRCLDFSSSHVNPQGWDNRSFCYNVHPVAE